MEIPLYHYAPAGRIIDAIAIAPPLAPEGSTEPPALWFTYFINNPRFGARSVQPGDPHDLWLNTGTQFSEQRRRYGFGRIVVPQDAIPLTWFDWAETVGLDLRDEYALEKLAQGRMTPVEFYRASFVPVPTSEWIRADVLEEGEWTPIWDSVPAS